MDLLTNTQASVAKAIINIFETSAVLGEYSKVTLIPGDTGHLTSGRSQTTLGSGNLHKLIAAYVGRCGARFAADFEPFLPELENPAPDFVLDTHTLFKNLLRAAADDPVMRDTQDEFFGSPNATVLPSRWPWRRSTIAWSTALGPSSVAGPSTTTERSKTSAIGNGSPDMSRNAIAGWPTIRGAICVPRPIGWKRFAG